MNSILETIMSADFIFSMIRISTPIIFASLAALITKKAGIINLAIDGMMLIGALVGVVVSALTQSTILGVAAAILSGLFFAYGLGFFAIKMQTNMRLAGIALNMFAIGGTIFALYLVSGNKGVSTSLASTTVPTINIPFIENIPFLGEILSGHNLLTYLAFLAVVGIHVLVYRTKTGLRIRSVGENPDLAESVGLSVDKIQLNALLLSGVLSSLAGVYLSMGHVSWFAREMTAGRGFIGIAAMNVGNATPIGSLLASLLFGFAESLSNQLQSLSFPVEFIQMTPFVFAIVGLVVFSIIREKREQKVTKSE